MSDEQKSLSPKPSLASTLREDFSRGRLDAEVEPQLQRSQASLSSTARLAGDMSPAGENQMKQSPRASDERTSVHINDQPSPEKEDVLVVDWDGPDDPANPKKSVLPQTYLPQR